MVAPTQVYRQHPEQRGRHAATSLRAAGARELPDSVLPAARREELKDLAREFRAGLSPLERVYVAGFLEYDALREWGGPRPERT